MTYAWFVVAISFIIQMLSSGSRYSMGVFLEPMVTDLGWSYAQVSLVIATFILAYGLLTPVVGLLTDRHGARPVITGGLLLMGSGFLLAAWAHTPWSLYLAWGIVSAAGYAGLTAVVHAALITRWFDRNKGKALGISTAGASAGQLLIVPAIVLLVAALGWRWAIIGLGGVLLLLVPVVMVALRRDNARDGGTVSPKTLPTESSMAAPIADQAALPTADEVAAPSADQAVETPAPGSILRIPGPYHRTGAFRLLVLSYFGCGFTMMFLTTHLPALLMRQGLTEGLLAIAMGLVGIAGIGGTLFFGALSDRASRKNLLGGLYFLRAAALVMLVLVPNAATALGFAVAFGITWAVTGILTSALAGDFFGGDMVGRVFGWCFFGHQVGGFIGAFAGGVLVDATGSYVYAVLMTAVVSTLSAWFSFRVPEERIPTVSTSLHPM